MIEKSTKEFIVNYPNMKEIASIPLMSLSMDEILDITMGITIKTLKSQRAAVFIYIKEKKILSPFRSHGYSDQIRGLQGHGAMLNKCYSSGNLESENGKIYIPLKNRENIFGVIFSERNPEKSYESKEIKIMNNLSARIAKAIVNLDMQREISEINEINELLLNNIRDMAFIIDLDGRFRLINREAESILGYKKHELIKKSIFKFLKDDSVEILKKNLYTKPERGEENILFELEFIKRDGSLAEFEVSRTTVDYNGIRGELGLARNITKRKKMERRLKKNSEFLENILNNMTEGVMVIDRDFKINDLNRGFLELTGREKREVLGSHCYKISHKSDEKCQAPNHICPAERVFQSGEPFKSTHMHFKKDGSEVYVELIASPIRDSNGQIVQVMEVSRDITDRINSEKFRAHLANISESSHDAISSLDMEGVFTSWNKGAEEILGYRKQEIIGKSFGFIVPEEYKHTCYDILENVSQKGYLKGVETVRIAKNGKEVPVEMTISALYDGNNFQTGFTFIMRDISGRIETEKKLKEYAEKLEHSNKLKDTFTDILRHDLINPAGMARINLKSLEKRIEDEKSKFLLGLGQKGIDKLIEIIENVSKFSKLEDEKQLPKSVIQMNNMIDDIIITLNPQAEEKNIKLIFERSGEKKVIANKMIEDVFTNLIQNAIKYSNDSTQIEIDIEDKADNWLMSVKDHGIGIPDDYKEKIFERFERVKVGSVRGSGIGLAIARRIAEFHEGKIWVDDNHQKGSIFRFQFPKGFESKKESLKEETSLNENEFEVIKLIYHGLLTPDLISKHLPIGREKINQILEGFKQKSICKNSGILTNKGKKILMDQYSKK